MTSNSERLVALGRVVDEASKLEMTLRTAFCALVGSKFSSIVAGGQMASWLIDNCKALVDAHVEVPSEQRQRFKDLLTASQAAFSARNRLVHDVWTIEGDGSYGQMQSKRRSYELEARPVSVAQAEETARELTNCSVNIMGLLFEVFPAHAQAEVQLRWEDYLRSLPSEELEALIARRLRAMGQNDQ